MLQNLLRPFSYLCIAHPLKWRVDWLYPVMLTIVSIGVVYALRAQHPVPIFGETGLVAKLLSFVQTLPGFYIAALAAIATFNKIDIDRTMPFPTPKLDVVIQGKSVEILLTRRRFLCAMFAFLTAESLVIIVFGIAAISFCAAFKSMIPVLFQEPVALVVLAAYLLLFWQMTVASFLGLYYLGERLHQPDPAMPQGPQVP